MSENSVNTKKKKGGRKKANGVNSEVTAIIIILILVIIIITLIAVAISFLNKGKTSEPGKNNVIVVSMPDSSETAESLAPLPTEAPTTGDTLSELETSDVIVSTDAVSTAESGVVVTPTEPIIIETAAPATVAPETQAPVAGGTTVDVNYTHRVGAGTVQYADHAEGVTVGTISDAVSITIVQEYTDSNGVKWGKAKSGYWVKIG